MCRRFRFRRAGGEEGYEFKFAELGVEVCGDFGDAFKGLECFVFDVDDAGRMVWCWRRMRGDFAGFATQASLVGEAGADH